MMEDAEKILNKARSRGADHAEVFAMETTTVGVGLVNNQLKSIETIQSSGISLRLIKGRKIGVTSSTHASEADALVSDAIAAAEYGSMCGLDFPGDTAAADKQFVDTGIAAMTQAEMLRIGKEIVNRLHGYEKKLLTDCTFEKEITSIRLLNSAGFSQCYQKSLCTLATVCHMVEAKNFLEVHEVYSRQDFSVSLDEWINHLIDKVRTARVIVDIPCGKLPVIFTPKAVTYLLWTLQTGLNGRNIARAISPLTSKQGKTVFDARMTIRDNGKLKNGSASFPFDDEGIPVSSTVLVENGVVMNYLLDLTSAAELQLPPTGNGFKKDSFSFTRKHELPPTPHPTNWVMEGGKSPYKKMVTDVKCGLLIDQLMGIHTSNILNGDFSCNVSLGYKIDQGEIVGRVKDIMISGNVYEMLSSQLVDISKEVCWSYGSARSHLLPYLCLKDISVTGSR